MVNKILTIDLHFSDPLVVYNIKHISYLIAALIRPAFGVLRHGQWQCRGSSTEMPRCRTTKHITRMLQKFNAATIRTHSHSNWKSCTCPLDDCLPCASYATQLSECRCYHDWFTTRTHWQNFRKMYHSRSMQLLASTSRSASRAAHRNLRRYASSICNVMNRQNWQWF